MQTSKQTKRSCKLGCTLHNFFFFFTFFLMQVKNQAFKGHALKICLAFCCYRLTLEESLKVVFTFICWSRKKFLCAQLKYITVWDEYRRARAEFCDVTTGLEVKMQLIKNKKSMECIRWEWTVMWQTVSCCETFGIRSIRIFMKYIFSFSVDIIKLVFLNINIIFINVLKTCLQDFWIKH